MPDRLQQLAELLSTEGFLSGQAIAKRTGVSRSAVWKYIVRLRRYGYGIESKRGMGYRLAKTTDLPVPWELAKILKTSIVGKSQIIYRENIDSTQSLALRLAEKGGNIHGLVVIAEQQTSGRGRMKRKWISPKGGIWLSVVLKPLVSLTMSTMLPFVAALAVCDAIRQSTKADATLKWPNDVMMARKKVAGILLDMSAEADMINYVVIGIGINANVETSKLKVDRQNKPEITSIRQTIGRDVNRLQLTALVLEKLEMYYSVLEKYGSEPIIREWRARSDMLGKKVTVIQQDKTYSGVAADINEDGSLLLKTKDQQINIVSGDVIVN
jgi:BirA family biotin operon repressor/biotin-[acetyl-CoA-carboxylase] ligase